MLFDLKVVWFYEIAAKFICWNTPNFFVKNGRKSFDPATSVYKNALKTVLPKLTSST